jgi:hypothetical protein
VTVSCCKVSEQAVDEDVIEVIRQRAYQIWLDEGRPEGRAEANWELASELVALERNPDLALKPNPLRPGEEALAFSEPIEPIAMTENLGEFPTLTDQGEERVVPIIPDSKSACVRKAAR